MPLRKHKLLYFLFIPALGLASMAFYSDDEARYEALFKIPLDGGTFTTDNIQNAYVYSRSTLKKYDSHGNLLFRYDDKSYGNITYIDVTDPMKVMVFYKDFPEIVFLDNTLSLNGNPISPADLGYTLTTLASLSHDNGVWLYDAQGVQLVRIDNNLNITQKTGNLVQSIGVGINPDYLMEYNSYVYLNDSAQGILVFDQYGTYYKTIPLKGLTTFEIRGDDLFYMLGNTIRDFHLKAITEDITHAPDNNTTMARVEKNMLFEASNDTLRVYKVK